MVSPTLDSQRARFVGRWCLGIAVALGASWNADAAVSFVQGGTGSLSRSNATFTFSSAQQAGDLNVIAVGLPSGSQISTVTDSAGNTYSQAVLTTIPSEQSGAGAWEIIYYAPNIRAAAAGTNTVTVAFGLSPGGVKVNVAEYSGIATSSPLDVTAGATGAFSRTGGTASSGPATTTNASDLLIGAYWSSVSGAGGTSYVVRVGSGVSFVEDQTVATTGSYAATASSATQGWWVMQLASFKAATGSGSVCD